MRSIALPVACAGIHGHAPHPLSRPRITLVPAGQGTGQGTYGHDRPPAEPTEPPYGRAPQPQQVPLRGELARGPC
jgi:hypothetical protein